MGATREIAGHLWRWWHLVPESWKLGLEGVDWLLAVVWCVRTRTLIQRLPEVPDLSEARWDLGPGSTPGLVVVVPAKDEAATIRPAMETLLAQDYPWMRVIAVDDRSTDGTAEILEALRSARPDRMAVMQIQEAAEGWVAKTYAMESAARQSRSEWLLFTDADVWFSPSILRRALAYAEMSGTDHLVVMPSAVIQGWGESVFLGFLSVLAVWLTRPWRVADPRAARDAVGAGGFNLVRRLAWEELGGFEPQRLAVVEDVTLGRRVRAFGLRQRVVFAPGLVLVHWATKLRGLVRGLTKNFFAAAGFQLWLVAAFFLFLGFLFVLPVVGLGWRRTWLPSIVVMACVGVHYRVLGEVTGVEARWGWLYPLGAAAVLWAMLRSAAVTLWRGGVRWRETFYPLQELRPWNSPWHWEFVAAKRRAERRKAERQMRPGAALRLWKTVRRGRKPRS